MLGVGSKWGLRRKQCDRAWPSDMGITRVGHEVAGVPGTALSCPARGRQVLGTGKLHLVVGGRQVGMEPSTDELLCD